MAKKRSGQQTDNQTSVFSKIKQFFRNDVTLFIFGLIILMFTVYATLSMISFFFTGAADQSKIEAGDLTGVENWTGARGAWLSYTLMTNGFGISSFFILLFLAFTGLKLMKVKYFPLLRNFIFCSIGMIWLSVALTFFFGKLFYDTAIFIGGKHGFILTNLLIDNLGLPGTFFVIVIVFVIIMTFITARTIPFLRRLFKLDYLNKKSRQNEKKNENNSYESVQNIYNNDEQENNPEYSTNIKKDKEADIHSFIEIEEDNQSDVFEIIKPKDEEYVVNPTPTGTKGDEMPLTINQQVIEEEANELLSELGVYDPTLDLSNYKIPSIDLLKKYENIDHQINMEEQNANKNRIIQTLDNYGIKIKSIKATVGPTITLYEIVPEDGVRISKIRNLEDDIAMSLSALGIRIIAPMPGKGTIGIEVPNKDPQIVSMYSIIASKKFQESKFELPIALGKTITNEIFMVDLCKMPHLLVAGATGQGKSVGLNAAITSLLYKKHPAELKFVLIDPKMVEFSIYSVIEKHFLAKLPDADKPIITDFTKVIYTLNSLTKEMDDRYDLLMKAGSRNIKEYNDKFVNRRLNPNKGHKYMPYIVVIIDEFGDLIMTAGKEIELPIARIAQKARAVGIHMIIATQRPTTNIITGTIKANFPARVAFRVTSMIDSRTILDGPGANQLIGRGDLLFFQGSDMTRVQCAFVDTPEVEKISEFIGNQQAYPSAFLLPEYVGEEGDKKPGAVDLSDRDPLFDEAARLIVIHQQGSTSLIQRKFSIGYNRAGRLMDQLEAAKIVGPFEGSKARQVYIQDEYQLEQLLSVLKEK